MKQFITPPLTGGLPVFNEDLVDVLQEGYLSILKSQMSSMRSEAREGWVLSGAEVTAGADFNVAEGLVFIDGEFYTLPVQASVVNPSYIIPTTDVITQRVFKDQSTKNVFATKTATITGVLPVSGQYITINRITDDHSKWHTYSDFGTLQNLWTENANFPIQFKKNINGSVSWRGALEFTSGVPSNDVFITGVDDDLLGTLGTPTEDFTEYIAHAKVSRVVAETADTNANIKHNPIGSKTLSVTNQSDITGHAGSNIFIDLTYTTDIIQ